MRTFLTALVALMLLAGCAASASQPSATATPLPVLRTAPSATPSAASSAGSSSAPASEASPFAAQSPADWTMYHHDLARSGYISGMADPQKLSLAWNTPLDGAVYAEPLVAGGHVLVATENDSVYSLDGKTGKIEWRTNVGQPVSRTSLPCGDIDPLGITGTPVYDPGSGLVFAVAEIAGPSHILVGIDARTGQVRVKRPADPQGMDPRVHQQRAALALANRMVYIAYGGLFGDCGDYHGTVVASKLDGTGPLLSFQVPTGREGGIWAPPGPAVDASGHLFVSVGNGSGVTGAWDKSDSVLRLSPTLTLEDGFAPDRWGQDNLTDADLGSLGPVLLPNNLVLIAGKAGIAYLLKADKLGGVGGQIQQMTLCHAYGGAASDGSTAFLPCVEGVQQVKLGAGPSIQAGWQASGIAGSPVIGGKTVYAMDGSGTLHALDIDTGKDRASVAVGRTTRFATPTLYGNFIYVGTAGGVAAVTGS